MPSFTYTARELSGQSVRGTLAAGDRGEALQQLAQRQLFPVDVTAVPEKRASTRRIPAAAMAQFYQQMGDLLSAGVPLLRALGIIEDQTADATLAGIVGDIRTQVADGTALAEAMRRHPAAFPDFVLSLVEAGEEGDRKSVV